MITLKDVEKLKSIFVTKEEFSTTVRELISFIERFETLSEQMNEFRSEVNEFRTEMRGINRNNRTTLDNHEVRINRLEYVGK